MQRQEHNKHNMVMCKRNYPAMYWLLQNSKYRITDQGVDFQIEKVGIDECWPRLTVEQKRPAWLKIDFDRFSYEDESDENRADADAMEEVRHLSLLTHS